MIRLNSTLSILTLVTALALGLVVGLTGAIIDSKGASAAADYDAQRAAVETSITAAEKDLATAKDQLAAQEEAREQARKRYNGVGSKLDRLSGTVAVLKEQNANLQSQIDALITAPSVTGLFSYDAENVVQSAGLQYASQTVEGTCGDYLGASYNYTSKVFKQYPSAGTKMASNSFVTLYYLINYEYSKLNLAGNLCNFSGF